MAPHVLVADDDAWILRMVATVLEKRGYSVETAVDGEDALERALARTPDLLITDVMMPKMDGWSLVRQLRSHPDLALMPVIFLTALSSEDDRIRGFRLGADDYVTKPFRFEELDLRVAKTLRRAQQTQQDTRDQLAGSGLRGDLSQVGLSSLLVLIEMERKTGLLQMRAPGGPSGQILVREGKVVHARLDEQEDPVDAECVYYMLTWGAGEFEFIACVVEGVDRVTVSTTHLLMEGARLMDEANEPSMQPAVTIPPRISQEFPSVQPDADEALAADEDASSSDAASTTSDDALTTSDDALTTSDDAATTSDGAATTSDGAATTSGASNEEPMPRTSDPGTLSSMWTLTGDDSVQVDESSSLDASRSRQPTAEPRATAGQPNAAAAEANDAPTVIPGLPARSSSPVIPPASSSSEANEAPTVIPGLPTRASSPALDNAQASRASSPAMDSGHVSRPSSPAMEGGQASRASTPAMDGQQPSPAMEGGQASRASSPSMPAMTTSRASSPAMDSGQASRASSPSMPATATSRASSPAMPSGSQTPRALSPSLSAAAETSRASSPSMQTAAETSRASSPSMQTAAETSRASSPAIPPIPAPPTRKSTPSMPTDKPASASGPMAVIDDPSDDWE